MHKSIMLLILDILSFILYLLNDNYHDMNRKQMKIVYTHENERAHRYCGSTFTKLYTNDRGILKLPLLQF